MHDDPSVVHAHPTKDFFISMLVRDIELLPAVADLADNSIDAARAIRDNETLDGLEIEIEAGPERFRIWDNCGGMSASIARNYAFCFGRPEGMPELDHSIGQFGVGMKRALFKLGTQFVVESTAAESDFVLPVNVEEWRDEPNEWEFRFASFHDDVEHPEAERGTTITVDSLHPSVAEDFADPEVLARLRDDMGLRHQMSITRGLTIRLNGDPLEPGPLTLKVSDEIHPARSELVFGEGRQEVKVALMTGIDASSPTLAGWYVFCNDRLVRAADQTALTGWGTRNGVRIPKYHNQYAQFRGYAFFDAADADRLPWDTTKTKLNTDSEVYRQVRRRMAAMTRAIIDFLDDLAKEKTVTGDGDPGLVEAEIAGATFADLDEIAFREEFQGPAPVLPEDGPAVVNILYQRSRDDAEALRDVLGLPSFKAVGEWSFDKAFSDLVGEDDGE